MRKGEAGLAAVVVIGLLFTLFAEAFYGDVEFNNSDSNTTKEMSVSQDLSEK